MTIDRMGRDELMNAVIDGDLKKATRLLAEGADPNRADTAGWCALHYAAQNNDAPMVRALIVHGASTETRDQHGNTPLWRAVFSYRGGLGESILALLEAGADPESKNNSGNSPRSVAESITNYDTGKFFAQ